MRNLLAVALGGAAGALCRHGANVACVRWFAAHAALGTMTVNVVGCFLLGVFAASPAGQSALAHAAVAIGFLGGFTTFSTFGLETVRLMQGGSPGLALANAIGSVALGVAAVVAGLQFGRWIYG